MFISLVHIYQTHLLLASVSLLKHASIYIIKYRCGKFIQFLHFLNKIIYFSEVSVCKNVSIQINDSPFDKKIIISYYCANHNLGSIYAIKLIITSKKKSFFLKHSTFEWQLETSIKDKDISQFQHHNHI